MNLNLITISSLLIGIISVNGEIPNLTNLVSSIASIASIGGDKLQELLQGEVLGPQDSAELAAKVLAAAWSAHLNVGEVSAQRILETAVSMVAYDERLYLLRLLELMDKNMDGRISKKEFTSLYSGGMGTPDQALELMFLFHDLDGNGAITVWEHLNTVLTLSGINQNLHEAWREAQAWVNENDIDRDGVLNLNEFMLYMVREMTEGITDAKTKGKDSATAVPDGPAVVEDKVVEK